MPGVDIVHVKIPEFEDSTSITDTPLVLLVAKISTDSSGRPTGSTSISIDEIADPVRFKFINPESIISLVEELTNFSNGGVTYPSPLLTIRISLIVLKSFNVIVGDTSASGLNVLSEE